MKIVCQSCSATYKIADDKVQGKKVFKIKCKKCGADILVRGTDAPPEHDESHMDQPGEDERTRMVPAQDGGVEAVWHAVLNGDQQGPFSVDQLRDLMAQGQIDTETYVWRDGFEGWAPMREVPDLAMLAVPVESASMAPASHADLFGGAGASPAPAAMDNRVSRGAEPAKARIAPKGGDLFAPEAREQESSKPLFAAEEPKAAPSGDHLTGQRNENSVLFSLATLQQLSGKETKPAAPNADASGLIDINKLAGALNTVGGGGKKSTVDDIMSVGASSGMASPLAAPVLAPVAVPVASVAIAAEPPRPQGVNKTVLATGVAVAAILVGGAVVAAMMMGRNNNNNNTDGQNVAANTATTAPTIGNPNAAPPPSPVPAVAPPPAAAAPAAPPPTTTPEATDNSGRDRDRPSRDRDRPRNTNSGNSAPSAPTPAPTAVHAPSPSPAAPSRPGTRSIDDLMNAVQRPAPGASPSPAANSGGGGDLPETPDRNTVRAALNSVAGPVRSCGTGAGGTATVAITFANTGRVTTANVSGVAPGPAVGCIVGAVRRASLPPFSRATFTVTFPFGLN